MLGSTKIHFIRCFSTSKIRTSALQWGMDNCLKGDSENVRSPLIGWILFEEKL